jgi:hypothetical protein
MPHPFTWFVFGLINGIVFFGQVAEGAGAGSWNTAMTFFACTLLTVAGVHAGRDHIRPFDWFCLAGALLSVVLWVVTKEPLTAVVVATVTDALAFLPTVRKAYAHPYTETASLYVLGTMKYVLGFFALETINLTTALFPVSIVTLNAMFLVMLFLRRQQHRP